MNRHIVRRMDTGNLVIYLKKKTMNNWTIEGTEKLKLCYVWETARDSETKRDRERIIFI